MITNINEWKQINESNIYNKINNWLKQFPTDTNNWSEATNELTDFHKALGEIFNEFATEKSYNYADKKHLYDFDKYFNIKSSRPSEFNKKHKEGINILLQILEPKHVQEVYDNYSHWFDINESIKLNEKYDREFYENLLINKLQQYYNKFVGEFNIKGNNIYFDDEHIYTIKPGQNIAYIMADIKQNKIPGIEKQKKKNLKNINESEKQFWTYNWGETFEATLSGPNRHNGLYVWTVEEQNKAIEPFHEGVWAELTTQPDTPDIDNDDDEDYDDEDYDDDNMSDSEFHSWANPSMK